MRLGDIQLVEVVRDEIWVANLIAQHGISVRGGVPPIRYLTLRECLRTLAGEARRLSASVHMPRIGCGLAGGKWEMVAPIIEEELNDLSVTVYDL